MQIFLIKSEEYIQDDPLTTGPRLLAMKPVCARCVPHSLWNWIPSTFRL